MDSNAVPYAWSRYECLSRFERVKLESFNIRTSARRDVTRTFFTAGERQAHGAARGAMSVW
jgi:hypothetical protein